MSNSDHSPIRAEVDVLIAKQEQAVKRMIIDREADSEELLTKLLADDSSWPRIQFDKQAFVKAVLKEPTNKRNRLTLVDRALKALSASGSKQEFADIVRRLT